MNNIEYLNWEENEIKTLTRKGFQLKPMNYIMYLVRDKRKILLWKEEDIYGKKFYMKIDTGYSKNKKKYKTFLNMFNSIKLENN